MANKVVGVPFVYAKREDALAKAEKLRKEGHKARVAARRTPGYRRNLWAVEVSK